jgi:hypothetical protein
VTGTLTPACHARLSCAALEIADRGGHGRGIEVGYVELLDRGVPVVAPLLRHHLVDVGER